LTYSEVELAGSMWKGRMVGSDQLTMEESAFVVEILGQRRRNRGAPVVACRARQWRHWVAVPRFDEELTL
jgi:hypothetical protein